MNNKLSSAAKRTAIVCTVAAALFVSPSFADSEGKPTVKPKPQGGELQSVCIMLPELCPDW